jgi:hypothetical protein
MELSDATEKSPAIPGIDLGTSRLVAHCLNHYATPGPTLYIVHVLYRILNVTAFTNLDCARYSVILLVQSNVITVA